MDTKTAAALALAAAVLVVTGGIAIGVGAVSDPDTSSIIPVAVAKQQGLVPDYATYKIQRSDGGFAYVAISKDDAGQDVKTLIDHSPCTKRPAKSDPTQCMKNAIDIQTGKPIIIDPGDENVMQSGQSVGPGCVETECVKMFGDP